MTKLKEPQGWEELWKELVDWVGSGFRYQRPEFTGEGLAVMKPKFEEYISKAREKGWNEAIEIQLSKPDAVKALKKIEASIRQKERQAVLNEIKEHIAPDIEDSCYEIEGYLAGDLLPFMDSLSTSPKEEGK